MQPPHVPTVGSWSLYAQLQMKARDALCGAGFLEVSTHALTASALLEKTRAVAKGATITNALSSEYDTARGELASSLLEVLSLNTHREYPQNIFECAEVVEQKGATHLHASAACAHANAGLSEIATALDFCMKSLGKAYELKPLESSRFAKGRAAAILVHGKKIGEMGELHPEVLDALGVSMPCALFEIEIARYSWVP